jgi:hypothetical protein
VVLNELAIKHLVLTELQAVQVQHMSHILELHAHVKIRALK